MARQPRLEGCLTLDFPRLYGTTPFWVQQNSAKAVEKRPVRLVRSHCSPPSQWQSSAVTFRTPGKIKNGIAGYGKEAAPTVKTRKCRLVGSPCTQRCVGRLTRHLLPRILRAPLGSTGEGVLHVCSAREWNVAVMSITCGGDVSGAGISAVSASCHGLSCRASSIKQLSPGNHKRKKNITCYLSEKSVALMTGLSYFLQVSCTIFTAVPPTSATGMAKAREASPELVRSGCALSGSPVLISCSISLCHRNAACAQRSVR